MGRGAGSRLPGTGTPCSSRYMNWGDRIITCTTASMPSAKAGRRGPLVKTFFEIVALAPPRAAGARRAAPKPSRNRSRQVGLAVLAGSQVSKLASLPTTVRRSPRRRPRSSRPAGPRPSAARRCCRSCPAAPRPGSRGPAACPRPAARARCCRIRCGSAGGAAPGPDRCSGRRRWSGRARAGGSPAAGSGAPDGSGRAPGAPGTDPGPGPALSPTMPVQAAAASARGRTRVIP